MASTLSEIGSVQLFHNQTTLRLYTRRDQILGLAEADQKIRISFHALIEYLEDTLGPNNPIKITNKSQSLIPSLDVNTDFLDDSKQDMCEQIVAFDFDVTDEATNALINLYRDENHVHRLLALFLDIIDNFHHFVVTWQRCKSQSQFPFFCFSTGQQRKYHYFYVIWINLHALFDAYPDAFHNNPKTATLTHYSAYANATAHLTGCVQDGIVPWMYPDSGVTTPMGDTVEVFYEMVFYAKTEMKSFVEGERPNKDYVLTHKAAECSQQCDQPRPPTHFPGEYLFAHNHNILSHDASPTHLVPPRLIPDPRRVANYLSDVTDSEPDDEFTYIPNTLSSCFKLEDQFKLVPLPIHHQFAVCLEGLLGMALQYIHRTVVFEQSATGFGQLMHIAAVLHLTPQISISDLENTTRLSKNILKQIRCRYGALSPHPNDETQHSRPYRSKSISISNQVAFMNSATFHSIITRQCLSHFIYPLTPSLEPSITNILTTEWSGVLSPLGRFYSESAMYHQKNCQWTKKLDNPDGDHFAMCYDQASINGQHDFEMVFKSSLMLQSFCEYNRWFAYRAHFDQRYQSCPDVDDFGAVRNKQLAEQHRLRFQPDFTSSSPRQVIPALPVYDHQHLVELDSRPLFEHAALSSQTDNRPYELYQFPPSSPLIPLLDAYPPHIQVTIFSRLLSTYPSFFRNYWLVFLSNVEHRSKSKRGPPESMISPIFDELKRLLDSPARISVLATGRSIATLAMEYVLAARNINRAKAIEHAPLPENYHPTSPHPLRYRLSPRTIGSMEAVLSIYRGSFVATVRQDHMHYGVFHGNEFGLMTHWLIGQYGARRLRYRSIYKNDCKPSKLHFSNVANYDSYIAPELTPLYRDTSLNLLPKQNEYNSPTLNKIPPSQANPRLFPESHDQILAQIDSFYTHFAAIDLSHRSNDPALPNIPTATNPVNPQTQQPFFTQNELLILHLFLHRNMGENLFTLAASLSLRLRKTTLFEKIIDQLHQIIFQPPQPGFTGLNRSQFYTRQHLPRIKRGLCALYIDTLSHIVKGFSYNAFETNRYNAISSSTMALIETQPRFSTSIFALPDCSLVLLGQSGPESLKMKLTKKKTPPLNSALSYQYNTTRTACDPNILSRSKVPAVDQTNGRAPIELTSEFQGAMVQVSIELFIDLLLDPITYSDISTLDFVASRAVPTFIPLTNHNIRQGGLYSPSLAQLSTPECDPNGISVFTSTLPEPDFNDCPILVPSKTQHNGFFNALPRDELDLLLEMTELKAIYHPSKSIWEDVEEVTLIEQQQHNGTQILPQPRSDCDIRPHAIINDINVWAREVFSKGPTLAKCLFDNFGGLVLPEWAQPPTNPTTHVNKVGAQILNTPEQVSQQFSQVSQLNPGDHQGQSSSYSPTSTSFQSETESLSSSINTNTDSHYNTTPVYAVNTQQHKILSLRSMMSLLSHTNKFFMTFTPPVADDQPNDSFQ